ncbi:MAG TPA: glycosyltransferase family 39 protein, partial [Anaeromyxobacteraceae bacterium]|nr:glycosyltransferase family 39 protein [Anaeromyxobacteraceae bacterium]
SRRERAVLAGLFALALALRAYGAADEREHTGDEPYHVPAAKEYCASGRLDDTTWSHPPLAPLTLCASIALLGDGPWGWRLRNILFGSLSVVALMLLARELFADRPSVASVAGLLLAIDPLHVLISRSTLEETQAALFFLLAAWLVARHVRRGARGLVAAGLLLGAAHATKAYYHVATLLLLVAALAAVRKRGGGPIQLAHVAIALAIVPAAVYLATYLPWFGRGYGLADFLSLQWAALQAVGAKTVDTFENGRLLALGGAPASWFVRPVAFGVVLPSAPDQLRAIVFTKNPVAWMAVLPSIAFVSARWRSTRSAPDLLLIGLFAGVYLPLLLLRRPIFLYSAVALLPFAFLAVARAMDLAGERLRAATATGTALACATALYLYPVATARAVPRWAYAPVAASIAPDRADR